MVCRPIWYSVLAVKRQRQALVQSDLRFDNWSVTPSPTGSLTLAQLTSTIERDNRREFGLEAD
jgi:hypothetical protein